MQLVFSQGFSAAGFITDNSDIKFYSLTWSNITYHVTWVVRNKYFIVGWTFCFDLCIEQMQQL